MSFKFNPDIQFTSLDQQSLWQQFLTYCGVLSNVERVKLKAVFDFAFTNHLHHTRKIDNKTPYFTHPLRAAIEFLVDVKNCRNFSIYLRTENGILEIRPVHIAAALLVHDVPEECASRREDGKKFFNTGIAYLKLLEIKNIAGEEVHLLASELTRFPPQQKLEGAISACRYEIACVEKMSMPTLVCKRYDIKDNSRIDSYPAHWDGNKIRRQTSTKVYILDLLEDRLNDVGSLYDLRRNGKQQVFMSHNTKNFIGRMTYGLKEHLLRMEARASVVAVSTMPQHMSSLGNSEILRMIKNELAVTVA